MSSSYKYVVPESTTEVYYPKSKRRVKLDSEGNIIEDTREGSVKVG
ncbi:MAG TPA: hypothetical protein VFS97_09145 [Nitrososphaeraceae archaeon]|nr:hypothetical protein [Nitrososphaeraceae archaeon]